MCRRTPCALLCLQLVAFQTLNAALPRFLFGQWRPLAACNDSARWQCISFLGFVVARPLHQADVATCLMLTDSAGVRPCLPHAWHHQC
jgi:hypothetical protein